MTYKSLILVAYIAILSACGEGTVSDPLPPPTLTFTGSNLDQFAIGGVPKNISLIAIHVNEELNPNSVNNTSVHLMVGNSAEHANHEFIPVDTTDGSIIDTPELSMRDTIDGNVRYDAATKTIYFEPRQVFDASTNYHIRIHDVELKDGRKIVVEPTIDQHLAGVIQFNFTTSHEHEVIRTQYDKEGNPTSYATYVVENNRVKELKRYNKNREIQYILQYDIILPTNRVAYRVMRNKLGEITRYWYSVTENGATIADITIKDPGTDGIWGNDNDIVESWSQPKQGHLTHQITNLYSLVNKSAFVTWTDTNNPEFELTSVILTESAGIDFQHRIIIYKNLGANGEIDINPLTGDLAAYDDAISWWQKSDFENGKRVRTWSLKGNYNLSDTGYGFDGVLFSDDDIAIGLETREYYPEITGSARSGLLKRIVSYSNSIFFRPMDQWLTDKLNNLVTPDAPLYSYTNYNYDENGNTIEIVRYLPGDDGTIASDQEILNNTADDILVQRRIFSTLATINGDSHL